MHLISQRRVFVFIIRAGERRRHWQMAQPPENSQCLLYGQRMDTTVDILSFTLRAKILASPPPRLKGTVPPVQKRRATAAWHRMRPLQRGKLGPVLCSRGCATEVFTVLRTRGNSYNNMKFTITTWFKDKLHKKRVQKRKLLREF
jgi:hypothetical protein